MHLNLEYCNQVLAFEPMDEILKTEFLNLVEIILYSKVYEKTVTSKICDCGF